MIKVESENTLYLRFLHLTQYKQLLHFVSTRQGGVSPEPGSGLNVGFHKDDQDSNVLKNREILADSLGISPQSFCFLNQVHGDQIAIVDKKDRGWGAQNYQDSIAKTDALITNDTNICLNVLSADCVGILFYDPVKQVIGAAHSGWKGTVKKIAAQTIKAMQMQFGSQPKDMLVGLGPAISPEIYEVGEVVEDAVEQAFGSTFQLISQNKYTGKLHFNLWAAIEQTLLDAGVQAKNIEHSNLCSYRNPSLFFSYRRDKGQTGRFISGIMLKNS